MTQYKNIPQASDARNQSQVDILNNFNYLSLPINGSVGPFGVLTVDHRASGDNVANPKDGFHNQVSLKAPASGNTNLTNAVNGQNSDGIVYTIADGASQQQLRFTRATLPGGPGFEDVILTIIRAYGVCDTNGNLLGGFYNLTFVSNPSSGLYNFSFPNGTFNSTNYGVYATPEGTSSGRMINVSHKTTSGFRVEFYNNAGTASNPPGGFTVMVLGLF